MTAKVNPGVNNGKMGQRAGMSAADVRTIRKMYCLPQSEF